MALSLVIASCGPAVVEEEEEEEEEVVVTEEEEEEEVVVEEEEEAAPTGVVPWWKKDPTAVPEYGGTFTYRMVSDPLGFDPYYSMGMDTPSPYEGLGMFNWMETDPEIQPYLTKFIPISAFTGQLAESWEVVDWANFIFHIRKGVHWHDIPPVNGRELTAYDVEYTYHRMMGLGSGFTEPCPHVSTRLYNQIESVTATDKYTVAFKMKEPTMTQFRQLLDMHCMSIVPREAIELWGDMTNFKHAVGTGPFILQDYVAGSSITAVRNPNYWDYDEHWPENRLPYAETMKALIIPDDSTAHAGLRTGRLDWVMRIDWEQSATLLQTNPELVSYALPHYTAWAIAMHVDTPPFDDFRVRRALQMSIDRETIAETYYGGSVPSTPIGQIAVTGFRCNYKDWPQEVKDGYAYNPEGAKELLAEAGYPQGFKCTMTVDRVSDLDLWQIIVAYFAEINVDMSLDIKDHAAYLSYTRAGAAVMSHPYWGCWETVPPVAALAHRTSTHYVHGSTNIEDLFMDELYYKANVSLDEEEQMALVREADCYIIKQQWTVNLLPELIFNIHQPWIKRYPQITSSIPMTHRASRLWIDQGLKKAMGR